MIKNNFKGQAAKYGVLSVIILTLSFAEINNLNPFAVAAFCSMAFSGANALILSVPLILGAAVTTFDWVQTAAVALAAGMTFFAQFFVSKNGKKWSVFLMIALAVSVQGAISAVHLVRHVPPVFVAINLCLHLMFTYVSYGIFKPMLYFTMKHSPTDTEKTCLYIVLTVCALGIASVNVPGRVLLFFAVGLALPLTCRFVGKGAGVMVALCFGMGSAFADLDVTSIALFGFVALASCMFISAPKILSPLAQVFAAVIFELFFNVDYLDLGYHAAALLAGGVGYALVPERIISAVRDKFFSAHSGTAVRHIINRNRYDLAKRARSVGEVFDEMSGILGGMKKSGENAVLSVAKEVTKSACLGCERYRDCQKEGLEETMLHLAAKTFEKGRASMSDLPYLLIDKCLYIGKIMSLCSTKVAALGMSAESIENENNVTRLLAEQFGGVGAILKNMSADSARPVSYDDKIERRIIEELKYLNIVCSEALVCLGDKPFATLIVRSECAENRKALCDVVGKSMGSNFYVKSVDDSVISGWSVVDLERCPVMDVTFGVASRPLKAEAIGDTHSFMKIRGDKFLMAVCDGMGSGEKAYDLSNKAMSLVEGFYRAGFSHEITVEGINRFLNIEEGEGFSALDIAVCDLNACSCDFVKLAAPASFIKRGDSVTAIDSESLPLGVVDEAKPFVTTHEMGDGDAIVIASDGVCARFNEGELAAFINNISCVNPQLAADEILNKAIQKRSVIEDDMTVAVCRVVKRT